MLMMLLRWVVMPARPGPADARDAPGGPGACLTSVADAPDDVVSAMPARPRPADAHAALAVGHASLWAPMADAHDAVWLLSDGGG